MNRQAVVADAGPLIALAKLERKGRQEAARMKIEVIGTGALIVAAKRKGLVKAVRPLLELLVQHGYRLSPQLQTALLKMSGEA